MHYRLLTATLAGVPAQGADPLRVFINGTLLTAEERTVEFLSNKHKRRKEW